MLIGLCAGGVLIASYFTAVAYRWVSPDTPWVPAICRMGERTCASIVFTPTARVLGPPNSVLGLLFYATLASGAASGGLDHPPIRLAALGATGFALLVSLYLTYSLLFVTRVTCVLCFASHAINLLLFAVLVWPV